MDKEVKSFFHFVEKYCTPQFIADHPELWYRLNHLKSSLVGPEQLEFRFEGPTGSKQ